MRTARINNEGVVEQVIVGTSEWATSRLGGTWIDTESKVGIGWTYSEEHGFRPPQPYPSWSWDGSTWVAPIPYPEDGQPYYWDEESQSWVFIENSGS